MTVHSLREYLTRLSALGVTLSLENGKVQVRAREGALSDEDLATLRARRDEIRAFLTQPASATPTIPRRAERAASAPVSSAQRRIWFVEQLAPGTPQYHIALSVRCAGDIAAPSLQAALAAMVERHEILRTVFTEHDGEPRQLIMSPAKPGVDYRDFSDHTEEARESQRAAFEREWATRPFDLRQGPLYRLALLRTDAGVQWLSFVAHHILMDARSVELFLRELMARYAGTASSADESDLLQYADYACWEQSYVASPALDAARSYWSRQLETLSVLRFPEDAERQPRTQRGRNHHTLLEPSLAQAITVAARSAGVSEYVVLQAGLAIALQRYTRQRSFGIATVVHGRTHEQLQAMLGCFVNLVLVRCELAEGVTTHEFLRQLGRESTAALAHQELPFDLVIAQSVRPEGRAFAARVCLLMEPPAEVDATLITRDAADGSVEGSTRFDLLAILQRTDRGIEATFQYRTELFSAARVEQLAGYFTAALRALVNPSEVPLDEIDVLSDAERARLVTARTRAPEPVCVHTLIERQASVCADRVAVIAERDSLTYAALDHSARVLAAALRSAGLRPGEIVGLLVERDILAVQCIFAILKAGAAYLPFDPQQPLERVRFIARDAGIERVVACKALGDWGSQLGVSVLWAEELLASPALEEPPELQVSPADPAYLMYTSGSTGTPKGVLIEHRHAVAFFAALDPFLGPGPMTWLAVSSFTFDLSVLDVLWNLSRGHTVVICAEQGGRVAPGKTPISALIRQHAVTHIHCTPSRMQMLLHQEDGPQVLAKLPWVVLGGEALNDALAQRLFGLGVGALINFYGPTEITVYATAKKLTAAGEKVTIGTPLGNGHVYVLDEQRRLVPTGAVGEIYIGGYSVARGYWNRAELTEQRFIPDPFSSQPGARMYATGDLGRYDEQMELQCLGRLDAQVKLRGYRIELGEIEAALERHPDIGRAAVVLHAGDAADPQLIAYYTAARALEAEPTRAFLRQHLPEPMIPARFIALEALPMTVSDKIDRKRLPPPDEQRHRRELELPRTSLERTVSRVWSEVLGVPVEALDVDQRFFESGGHSLAAAKVRARLSGELGRPIPLTALFEHTTIRQLAAYLEQDRPGRGATTTTPGIAPPAPRSARPLTAGVAVVGMACRFPGADSIDQFWSNLCAGVESISRFAEPTPGTDGDRYVPCKGVIEDEESFDAEFFGFTPKDAELTDPQHRVLLECVWSALEDAGHDPETFCGRIGLFAGSGHNSYLLQLLQQPGALARQDAYRTMLLNEKDYLTTRISHRLDLRGPSVTLQTACSTSLVAIHFARRCLLEHEADLVLAGGVSITFPLHSGYHHQAGGIQSGDGHCRPFAADCDGTVFSNGAGVVALRRLEDAERDGDRIYAVLRGSAINNDGAAKVGFTAPSIHGQVAVIRNSLASAGLAAGDIGYVEAHGTGTRIGDPIEISALVQAHAEDLAAAAIPCAIGSVKSNFGHLDAAAGIAGFIKAVLATRHGLIPASLHCRESNPECLLEQTRFRVATETTRWDSGSELRRAGVSSFGIGGTNAHVILEQSATPASEPSQRLFYVLPLSARTPNALRDACERLASHLESNAEPLADVAYTLQLGRRAFPVRCAIVAADPAEAVAALHNPSVCEVDPAFESLLALPDTSEACAQLAASLYLQEPLFRRHWVRCARELDVQSSLIVPPLGSRLREELMPPVARLLCWSQARAYRELGVESRVGWVHGHGRSVLPLIQCSEPAEKESSGSGLESCAFVNVGAVTPAWTEFSHRVAAAGALCLAPSDSPLDAGRGFAHALAALWSRGINLRWAALYAGERRRRVSLPGYRFQSRRYSLLDAVTPAPAEHVRPTRVVGAPILHRSRLAQPYRAPSSALERDVLARWQSCFGVEGIGVDDDFYELGGDSFLAVELVSELRQHVDATIDVELLVDEPTVLRLAGAVEHRRRNGTPSPSRARTVAELAAECVLDPTIVPASAPRGDVEPRRILLTGPTGFLGPFILRALLDELPDVAVVCVVRGDNVAACWQKLEAQLRERQVWRAQDAHRVTVVAGDLRQPRLGLESSQWCALQNDIDTIVHNGAEVNFSLPFARLQPSNVFGTETILRLASAGRARRLHYVSTTAVFETRTPLPYPVDETSSLDHQQTLVHGYAETKWAAEKLVWQARQRGLPVAIYRPGQVAGHSGTGVSNAFDLTSRTIQGLALLGKHPPVDQPLNFAPVDFVATAIASSVRRAAIAGEPLHLTNPKPCSWAKVLSALQRAGFPVEPVSAPVWRLTLEQEVASNREHPLFPVLPILATAGGVESATPTYAVDCERTTRALAAHGLHCPPISSEMLERYIAFFIRSGLLPAPEPGRVTARAGY